MQVYLVDRDLPGITREGLAAVQRAEISASEQLTAVGQPVRYLRSVFMEKGVTKDGLPYKNGKTVR